LIFVSDAGNKKEEVTRNSSLLEMNIIIKNK
jgi:hypothetical protein